MKKNPEIIFFFILGALGILSKQFLSQTKYYPNFLKDFNNPFIEGLIIAVVFIILFGVPGFFIILLVEKIRRDSKKNLRSFKTLNEYYLNGNVPRVVKQTLITLPFYFYIKFSSGNFIRTFWCWRWFSYDTFFDFYGDPTSLCSS